MFHNANRKKYNAKIQTKQNTNITKLPKYKRNKVQIEQNTKIPKFKHNKIEEDKIQMAKIQMQQNKNGTKYK